MPGGDPEKDVIYFARADFRGKGRLFGIRRNDRRQHTYVIGKTGTGKSAMLNNMIVQDIANGEGVCVVDPHGELVEGIMARIPEERKKDIIYFNPADSDYHLGFNVLELPDPKYKHLVASGLMGIFTKIWSNVWSARMEYIMNNAILALLETPNSTLLGILRILVDKEFRQKIIANVKDPVVRSFWVHEYEEWQDKFRNEAIAPIQNKVGQFLSTALIRNVVGQSKSTVDIFDIMNTGKIFLVNVSKGRIGEDNSALLGAMLITKIQLSAMERVRIPEDERVDFYLYVDEFQNFATDSFAGVLSEARKYRLNLILAHQYVGQLVTDVSTKVRDAIFGNVGTMIVFRIGALDAEFLEPEFEPEFTIMDIVNLPNYHIYLKLMVGGVTSRPFSAATLPPFKMQDRAVDVNEVIEYSRKRYARPREVVEDEIKKWIGMADGFESVAGGALSTAPGGPGGVGGRSASGGGQSDLSGPGFQVTCSSCGLETKVPFEPDPGRPVYCKDCLDKIKAGTMQPVRRKVKAETGPKADTSSLAILGIEFKPGEKAEKKEVAAQPGTVPSRPPVSRQSEVQGRRERPMSSGQRPPADTRRGVGGSHGGPSGGPSGGPRGDQGGNQGGGRQPERRASILEDAKDVPMEKESAEPLSLANLKTSRSPKAKKEHSRPAVNVDELRQAIAESLNKDDGDQKEK